MDTTTLILTRLKIHNNMLQRYYERFSALADADGTTLSTTREVTELEVVGWTLNGIWSCLVGAVRGDQLFQWFITCSCQCNCFRLGGWYIR
jgi:hypothetical protein